MQSLSEFIVKGEEARARELALKHPEALAERSADAERCYPADWALRAGRVGLYVFLLRHGARTDSPSDDPGSLLVRYIDELSEVYFGASHMAGIDRSIWEQLRGNRAVFFEGQEPEFGLAQHERDDLNWLLDRRGVHSLEELRGLLERPPDRTSIG